jgi:hypothetical protein
MKKKTIKTAQFKWLVEIAGGVIWSKYYEPNELIYSFSYDVKECACI